MNFLNNGTGYRLFMETFFQKTYVDKTMMIDTLYRYIVEGTKYICVTRPRRFGKTVAANMIAAFFDESTKEESRRLFETSKLGTLKNEQEKSFAADPEGMEMRKLCWPVQGKLKVFLINMIKNIDDNMTSYDEFISRIKTKMIDDLREAYPDLLISENDILSDLLNQTGDSFVFVIDEWDAIFERPFMTAEDKKKYLLFLKALLKDSPYVHFAYMTGILPIAKYTSGSPLNMFREFSAFKDNHFFPYFGLSRDEIQELMQRKAFTQPSLEELTYWYDGYIRTYDGVHMFNPESVACALLDGKCESNWTGTGPMNEVRDIIRHNVQELREDVIRMVGGETLDIQLSGFDVEKEKVSTKDEILSAMVVYGFLSYCDGHLRIPNHELMLKFASALSSQELGLKQTLEDSRHLLNATLEQKDRAVASMIEDLHTEKIPFFEYNDENSLACVVTMGYLAALDNYRITREDKAGKEYADFTFEPRNRSFIPIILELKYNHSVKNALKCIREKNYITRFREYPKVLLVGINYSERTKKHTCKTELMSPRELLQ